MMSTSSVFTTATSAFSLLSLLSFKYTATIHDHQRNPSKVEMKLVSLMLAAATTILSVQACKCVYPNGGGEDVSQTQFCCTQEDGTFVDGNDCAAYSISNSLSEFESCCRTVQENSDCPCPTC
jgi:hypothetical protein